jgi:F420-non-reducing hydrogenase large subunit
MKKISIDPITRLEGHGRIDLFLNDNGDLENAYMVIPELRGFEKFCEGRPVEEMPRITQRICGVCPIAHHVAAAKAGDAVYHVDPPPTAKKLRELMYSAFFVADHALHFYALAGPDFVVGPDAPKAERNILGVIKTVGTEIGSQVMGLLKDNHDAAAIIGGRYIHSVSALVGGVSLA